MLKVIGAGWSTMCFDNDHLHLSLLHQLISSFLLELGCWSWSLLLIWLSPHSPILSTNCALHFQKVTILCCCSCCSVGLLYFPIFPFPSSKSVVQVNLDHLTILRWHLEGDHKSQKGQLNSCFIHFYFLWNQFWQCQDLESSFSSCNASLYTGPRILIRFSCPPNEQTAEGYTLNRWLLRYLVLIHVHQLVLRRSGSGWALCWVAQVAVTKCVKEEPKVDKDHLWQRLGQDDDKDKEDEEDEVT